MMKDIILSITIVIKEEGIYVMIVGGYMIVIKEEGI